MDELIESIRLAVVVDASDDARRAGATACRSILLALDPAAGVPPTPSAATDPMPQIAAMLGALRGVPADQLLDLAIARLRAALPGDAAPAPVKPLKFHLVPVAPGGRR